MCARQSTKQRGALHLHKHGEPIRPLLQDKPSPNGRIVCNLSLAPRPTSATVEIFCDSARCEIRPARPAFAAVAGRRSMAVDGSPHRSSNGDAHGIRAAPIRHAASEADRAGALCLQQPASSTGTLESCACCGGLDRAAADPIKMRRFPPRLAWTWGFCPSARLLCGLSSVGRALTAPLTAVERQPSFSACW